MAAPPPPTPPHISPSPHSSEQTVTPSSSETSPLTHPMLITLITTRSSIAGPSIHLSERFTGQRPDLFGQPGMGWKCMGPSRHTYTHARMHAWTCTHTHACTRTDTHITLYAYSCLQALSTLPTLLWPWPLVCLLFWELGQGPPHHLFVDQGF